jgi:DNA-binding response OmpR family regulator
MKILIAEDEKALAHALELKLSREGYEIKTALNGEEALKILASETFDLLILDLIMPKIDGYGVLIELKKRNIPLKIIVASNLSQPEDIKKARELGADDYIIKSNVQLSEIVKKVKQILLS